MAIIDLVKRSGSPNLLAWKFQSEELSTWTQLVVNELQEAYLVRGGVYVGPFGAGRHTLSTENLPFLRTVIGIPFGGKSPSTAEVWCVNSVTNPSVTPDVAQAFAPSQLRKRHHAKLLGASHAASPRVSIPKKQCSTAGLAAQIRHKGSHHAQ